MKKIVESPQTMLQMPEFMFLSELIDLFGSNTVLGMPELLNQVAFEAKVTMFPIHNTTYRSCG